MPAAAAILIARWTPKGAGRPHNRLAQLLAQFAPEALEADTLGLRNQRLLRFYRTLSTAALEGQARCPSCAQPAMFTVPVEAVLACAEPPDERIALVALGGGTARFRLPVMADIMGLDPAAGDARSQLAARCRLDEGPALDETALERLAQAFDTLDPAAEVTLALECAACHRSFAAAIDIAGFVADGLDRVVEGLFRDVDVLARAYGWSEAEILALPAARRRRYVALASAAADGAPALRAVRAR